MDKENLQDLETTLARKEEILQEHQEVSLGKKETQSPGLIQQIEAMKNEGKTNTKEFRDAMAKLERILGVDQVNPFGTNELDVFEERLRGMTVSDMQALARRVGISSLSNQSVLKRSLLQEFKNQNKNNMRNIMPGPQETFKLDPNNPKHQKTIKILGEF